MPTHAPRLLTPLTLALLLCAVSLPAPAHAGFMDKLKDAAKAKLPSATSAAPNPADKPADPPAAAPADDAKPAPDATDGGAAAGFKAYGNYDFVPGDKILFEDDFMAEQDGEFPSHWDLDSGQGAIDKFEGAPSFVLTEGNYVKVRPLMKVKDYLTDPFTVEFDFYDNGGYDPMVFFKTGEPGSEKSLHFAREVSTGYFEKELSATYPGSEVFLSRWHHAAIAYKAGQIKCYVDQYRVLVVPHCGFTPTSLAFGGIGSPEQPIIFKHVRIAAGGGMNMLGHILTDGKLVTHAITFDVNRAEIRSESMGFLNQMAEFLRQNAAVKLEIDGHTDSDGEAAANLKLSQARADAVRTQLVAMGIDGARLTTRGYGASQPIAPNDSVEGKAANRRVEFVKS